jgi:2-amino-4-hydroxy-6-hydroxymethyldihydropteridine diphosphokinase
MSIFISLGTNIKNRLKNLDTATRLITSKNIVIVSSSKIYESSPMENLDQPFFLNKILMIDTILMPNDLLVMMKSIEKEMGRKKEPVRYLPRIIDIDLLTYKNFIISNDELIIPHPKIKYRKFILKPWTDIDPLYILPSSNITIKDHLESLSNSNEIVKEYKQ